MNILILKQALIFAFILGAVLGIISLIPQLLWICILILALLSAPIVIIYMKSKEILGIISTENAAQMGSLLGAISTVGFFVTFAPLVCIVKLIFKKYYAYAIPDMLSGVFWLFIVIVLMVALIFAATNCASTMGLNMLYSAFEKKPKDDDARLDIKIED